MIIKLVLICCLFLAFIGIAILVVSILSHFLGGIPFVTTPPAVMAEMMELADITKGEKVYDLGCGDGRLLIEANEQYGADAIGIELSPFVYFLARIKTRLSKAHVRLIRGSIYDFDFSDADVVFCYLMPKPMKRLEGKFRKLTKGARIISFRFEIPGWKPLVQLKRDHKRKMPPVFKYQV